MKHLWPSGYDVSLAPCRSSARSQPGVNLKDLYTSSLRLPRCPHTSQKVCVCVCQCTFQGCSEPLPERLHSPAADPNHEHPEGRRHIYIYMYMYSYNYNYIYIYMIICIYIYIYIIPKMKRCRPKARLGATRATLAKKR